jgi:hypothetical protein
LLHEVLTLYDGNPLLVLAALGFDPALATPCLKIASHEAIAMLRPDLGVPLTSRTDATPTPNALVQLFREANPKWV